MGGSGLENSRWASGFNNSSFQRTQNRKCHSCGMSNFSEGDLCFRCAHNPKIPNNNSGRGNGSTATALVSHPNGLSTPIPQAQQRGSPTQSGVATGSEALRIGVETIDHEKGLSTSRWAPRNNHGSSRTPDKGQVWTRTIHQAITNSPNPLSTSPSPDLGLPYQVQHYILAMIQRILEEGCFDFAFRWVPEALHTNHWDCPEAVELSKWREFLPTALPSNAIKPLPNTTLETSLWHGVQIRNKAVHRHLCDNNEIRRMALQGKDMMTMFSDVTRSEKFHHLWVELRKWDEMNRTDPQNARQKLEEALKLISERPVDDMDWTPNAVSLQEVTNEVAEMQADEEPEAMDLD